MLHYDPTKRMKFKDVFTNEFLSADVFRKKK